LGSAVTAALLDAGLPVTLKECSANLLDEGLSRLEAHLRDRVKEGMLTPDEMDYRMGLLTPTCWYIALSSVDVVIDCVDAKPDERAHVIASLDRVMRPGAILAANASSHDLEALTRYVRRPCDLVGVRFSHPAHEIRLMEIAKGERTADDAVATLVTLAAAMNRIPVVGCVL
jgi:3-hydroxyacyl-CoA dehydrogenase